MTLDEEMEVSGTVELEPKRRLTRLQKVAVPFYPSRYGED